ncbi:PREDICTED: H/ACA ribonucleoprotein complex non-core subunit NAF1 [Cyphomyrmex costatus]|uniref:H/ACA ribonucleoprotein complex non-core subunit NAF1 n=1 Tax=Cyphomyrmex costatus TaxID=456900 RepID=A0A195C3P4_9HYME|nr:PREDICTED: H/ACA ribonucleoprotein complex non-core subunit NAF1 [Cyphomyrmex costatus]KYM95472.1 H/ACA ribonucleoprotein complex non-core subunit NAF1 [Cyphomyrmex costatus]
METATNTDENKIVHKEILSNMLTSEEENKKTFHEEIELLTSQQLMHHEKSSKEEAEVLQLDEQPSIEHKEIFSDENLEKIDTKILINRECDKLDTTITLDANKTENAINNCDNIINEVTEPSVHNYEIQVNNPSLQKQTENKTNEISSLNLIAIEYEDTDSDVEETNTTTENQQTVSQVPNLQQYRTVEKQLSSEEFDSEEDSTCTIDSSSSNSSSSNSSSTCNSSSDSSSDSDPDDNVNINNRKKESEVNTSRKKKHIPNELDNLPPIEDLKISVPEVLCNSFGKIENIVEQLVIVKPNPGEPTLNLDTVLFVNKGTKALGKIFDVFGSVNEPYYCVRFNGAKHIEDNDIKVGMQVYYCPNSEYTSLVFLHELTKIKACDAIGDDEPPTFSDDEEEQAYYENMKQKGTKDSNNQKQKRQHQMEMGCQSNHSWNNNKKVQSQKYKWNQQNWNSGNHFNSAQNGTYFYNAWQQYNAYWPPVPQNIYPMSNRPYAGYRPTFSGPRLPQYGNPNSGAHQYYQGIHYRPNVYMNTPPSYSAWSPVLMPNATNTHWFPPVPPSSSNMTDANNIDPNLFK